MKKKYFVLILILGIAGVLGYRQLKTGQDAVYQYSTINAFLEGVYEGQMTCGELKQKGDFGLGTFNGVDGEMIVLDGECYQAKADGAVYLADDRMEIPFAVVKFFNPENEFILNKQMNYEQLMQYMDSLLTTENIFFAVRIQGEFPYIKTRSIPKQDKPYIPFVQVAKNQQISEFHNINGTLVGFRFPAYMKGLNVPGYHLHFISKDKKFGGHLLDCKLNSARLEIDRTDNFYMALPQSEEFLSEDLTKDKEQELLRVERAGSAGAK